MNRNWLRAVAVAAVCVGAAVFLAAALGGLAGIVRHRGPDVWAGRRDWQGRAE